MSWRKAKLPCHCVDESSVKYIVHSIWTPQLGRWSQAPWVTWCQRQGGTAEGHEGLRGRAAGAGSRVPTAPESSQPGFHRHLSQGAAGHLVLLYITVLPERLVAWEQPKRNYNHTCLCSPSHTQKNVTHTLRGLITHLRQLLEKVNWKWAGCYSPDKLRKKSDLCQVLLIQTFSPAWYTTCLIMRTHFSQRGGDKAQLLASWDHNGAK